MPLAAEQAAVRQVCPRHTLAVHLPCETGSAGNGVHLLGEFQ